MAENPYVDEWGHHVGYCNNPDCGEEQELGLECQFCDAGEIVAFEDDPDPDDLAKEAPGDH